MQHDMKKLIAYSSVAHMGIVTIGIFTPNALGISGQHRADALARRRLGRPLHGRRRRLRPDPQPRDHRYGGLAENMPVYATIFMLFMMASVGLPGTSGFIGEILVIIGAFQIELARLLRRHRHDPRPAYMLWLYRRVVFGNADQGRPEVASRTCGNEIVAFAPLVVLAFDGHLSVGLPRPDGTLRQQPAGADRPPKAATAAPWPARCAGRGADMPMTFDLSPARRSFSSSLGADPPPDRRLPRRGAARVLVAARRRSPS